MEFYLVIKYIIPQPPPRKFVTLEHMAEGRKIDFLISV